MNEQDLMQKLVLSKAIMDKSDKLKKGTLPQTSLQEFHAPEARYNIPPEMLGEQTEQPYLSSIPTQKPVVAPTLEAIKKSKLPEEIKKLMMEHPIAQPQNSLTSGPTLSDELVEKATRLMGRESKTQNISEKSKDIRKGITESSKVDMTQIKKLIKQAVNEALTENGLIVESTESSNETFQFRVGSHLFEGKVTKIKKLKN